MILFWKFCNLARNCEGCTIFAFRVVVKYTNNNRKSSSILRIVVSFRFQEGIFFFYINYYVSPRASTTIRGCVEICIYIVPPSTFSSCSYYHLYTIYYKYQILGYLKYTRLSILPIEIWTLSIVIQCDISSYPWKN